MLKNLFKSKKEFTSTFAGIEIKRFGYEEESEYEWEGYFEFLGYYSALTVKYRNESDRSAMEKLLLKAIDESDDILQKLKSEAQEYQIEDWQPDEEGLNIYVDNKDRIMVSYMAKAHSVVIWIEDNTVEIEFEYYG